MAIGPIVIFTIGFILLIGFVLVALLSGKHGAKVAAGIGAIVLAGFLLICAGIPLLLFLGAQKPTYVIPMENVTHTHAESQSAITIEAGSRSTLAKSNSPSQVAAPTRPVEPPVAEISSENQFPDELSIEQRVSNPGREFGMLIGSVYQGFRNRVKSLDLSVDPSKIIPPGRPDWVEQAPHWNDGSVYFVSVSSGPYYRGVECQKALDQEIDLAMGEFANDMLNNPQASVLLKKDLALIRQTVVAETYHEELTPSFGIMHQWHSLLKFDPAIQSKIRQLWAMQQRLSRVVYIGVGFLMILGLLSISYMALTFSGERSRVSPWLLSAGVVVSLGGLFVAGLIFFQSFPML